MTAHTLPEKIWDRHLVHSRARRTRPAVHRPAPRPRGHQPAGVRRAAPERSPRAPPRAHRGDRGPQRPDRRHRPADRRSGLGQAGRHAAGQRRRVRHHALSDGRPEPGHRPRHRSGAGSDAAGHDHRVRRQPHRDPRRVRRAGVRHRHERGRARAGHPDAAAVAAEVDGDRRRGRRAAWRDGQGHHPGDHRRDRHRRRDRPRHRVPRPGDRGAVDGRSHDGVQHVDRGGRPGRARRARRHDVRLPRGPHPRPQGRGVGGGARRLAVAAHRRRRGVGQAGHDRCRGAHAARHVGHEPRPGGVDRRRRSRLRTPTPIPRARESVERALDLHGSPRRARRSATSASTRCSSGRARTAGSRTCAPPPQCSKGARSR